MIIIFSIDKLLFLDNNNIKYISCKNYTHCYVLGVPLADILLLLLLLR